MPPSLASGSSSSAASTRTSASDGEALLEARHDALVACLRRACAALARDCAVAPSGRRPAEEDGLALLLGELAPRRRRARRRAPRPRATARSPARRSPRRPHASTTPSRSVWRGSPMQRSGSTTSRAPRPSHAGHAPCGPLNENMRGSMGGSEMPQSMQAKRSLIQNGSSSPACTSSRPSPSLSASSTLSVRRPLMPSFRTRRSTTTSRSCIFARSSSSSSPRSTTEPSMRARTKPSRRSRSSSSLSSPFRARAMGARTREPRALGEREHAVDDLLHRLRFDALAAARAVGDADARVEQAQVVGDLGDRADGGAGRLRERPLLDGDGGAEALDALDVGLGELLEELPRVGAERLDVAALPLGVDRVEGERATCPSRSAR